MLKPVPVEPVLSVKELYTLYYFHHESGYRFAGESHDFWEIIYVDKGRASGINGTEPYTLEKGQIIFHHPNVFHNFRTDGAPDAEDGADCDIFVVSFNGELEMLEQLLISLYRKQQECPAQVQSLPMQSLGMEYQIVRQVVTFLDQNIYNNITFVDVASHFNLSETQLKKLFREVTGYSVMQYYRKSVVGRIEYHIRQMDKNFTELADLFNFSSIHYFSKFYKRETGHTLREYLKSSQDVSLP